MRINRFSIITFSLIVLYGVLSMAPENIFFSFLQSVLAIGLILFLPGYLAIRIFLKRYLSTLEQVILGISCSFVVMAVAVSLVFSHFSASFSVENIQLLLVYVNLVLLGISVVTDDKNREEPVKYDLKKYWPFFLVGAIFLLTRFLHVLLYPYIPEGDTYSLILKIIEFKQHGLLIPSTISRPFFLQLFEFSTVATHLDPITLFRCIIPSFLIGVCLLPVLWLQRKQSSSLTQVVGGLLILSAPIVSLEIDIIRPQTVAILISFSAIYLLARWYESKKWELWVTAFLLSVLGFFFHELTIFSLLACLLALIPSYWGLLKKDYRKTLGYTALVLIAAFPYLKPHLEGGIIVILGNGIESMLKHPHFNFWFIDSYTNADGNNLGWPGLLSVVYYGYNLGAALVVGFIAFLYLKKKEIMRNGLAFASVCFLVAPLAFAEVFPHFGFAFLPDRAWLFLTLGLAFFIVVYLPRFSRLVHYLLLVAIVFSLGLSAAITYLKQGWITTPEYQASQWIKENTPESSLLYVQGGSVNSMQVYADRRTKNAHDIFTNGNYVSWVTQNNETLLKLQEKADTDFDELMINLKLDPSSSATLSAISSYEAIYQKIESNKELVQEIGTPKEVYIVYSYNKFDGLYGQRAWWREMNDDGVNLDFLNDKTKFKKVFSDSRTMVWEVLPN